MNPIDIVPREEAVVSRLVDKLWTRRDPVTGLAGHLVILPSLRGVRQMRYLLMERVRQEGGRGMLLPVGLNLWQVVEKVPSGSGLVPLSEVARVVRLAEWLQGQQERTVLFSSLEGTHPVRMAQFLLDAFDDLLRYSPLLDGKGFSFDSWSKEGAIESLVHLLDESVQQVISLLTDYVESLHLQGVDDPVHRRESEARRVARGDRLPHFIRRYEGVWVAGFDDATEGERCVLNALSAQPNCHVMAAAGSSDLLSPETGGGKSSVAYYHSKHPDYSASRLLKTFGYGGEPPLETSPLVDMLFPRINRTAGKKRTLLRRPDTCERAKEILTGWLPGSVVECEDPFHEAMWVAKRVREHMEEGKTVLVVTGEWHLASLVKQMLSFWNMDAESTFGSPLSQSWLFAMLSQVTEVKATGEHYRSLASLMRNPLFGVSSLSGQEGAHQLEREVAPNQGVASGLKSLIEACASRQEHLRADSITRGNPLDVSYSELVSTLEGIREGLAPLNVLGAGEHSVATWAKESWTLLETLTGAGLLDGFERPEEDRFVSILQSLCGPDGDGELRTTWPVFLELVNGFVSGVRVQPPRNRETPVMIADPTQARFLERDQTLFCGLVDDWFPGMEPTNPLIPNDARTYMGMISSGYWEGLRASYFATLLSRPREVQFSYHRQQGGTPMLRSRFLERLLGAVEELELPVEHFVKRTVFEYHWPDSEKSIEVESLKMTAHAWAIAPRELLPKRLSATQTQRLLECPYSWYCERILKLRPEEEVEEILTARDYGTEVHRILRAFHENEDRSDIPGLPGPFTGDLRADEEGAVKLMEEIGEAVFGELEMPDLGTHDLFEQFRGLIPTIVKAEIRRADEGWAPAHLETEFSWTPQGQSIAFTSKIDRLDVAEDGGVAVLDYKTGSTPPMKEITEGLRPQLFIGGLGVAHSQKFSGGVSQMSYYSLKPNSTKTQGIGTEDLTGKRGRTKCDTMVALLTPYQDLLERLVAELTAGQMTDLPAIPGDACKYCPYDGICRKDEVSK